MPRNQLRFLVSCPERLAFFGIFASTTGVGNAGDVRIETRQLTGRDGAELSVAASQNLTAAGDLEILADSISLDAATISAETRQDDSGNIILNAEDLILRRNSNITTNAAETATGGNIAINTRVAIRINGQII